MLPCRPAAETNACRPDGSAHQFRGKLIVSTRQSYAICSRRTGPKCAAASPSLQTNAVAAKLSTSPAVLDVRTRGTFMLISFTFGKLMI